MSTLEAPDAMRALLEQQGKTLSLLMSLFDDLLDLSRFEANQITPSPETFRLDEALETLATQYLPECQHKHLDLQVDLMPVTIRSDRQLLYRLLSNLISNAIRYTERGSIQLHIADTANGALIAIRDTGCGIAPEHQSIVFGEFQQIYQQQEHGKGRGIGLGLAIVKQIANVLEFKLHLTSEVGQGSCFFVTIPAKACISPLN